MMEDAVAKICPACGAASSQYHRVPWSFHEKTSENARCWHYYRCPDCGAAWLEIMKKWTPKDYAAKVYNEDYHLCDREYNGVRSSKILPKMMLFLLWANQEKRVLDYGGGEGSLAGLLRKRGVDAYTYDPYGKQDENALERQYDAVSAIEVLEHDIRPHDLFEKIAGLLVPGGVFIGTTEFIGEHDIEDWFYANPRAGHCLLWTEKALDLVAAKHGFQVLLHSENWHIYKKG